VLSHRGVFNLHIAVNNKQPLSVAMETPEWVIWHHHRATKYYILLSTIQTCSSFYVKCHILIKFGVFRQIFAEVATIKFKENSPVKTPLIKAVGQTDAQTDG